MTYVPQPKNVKFQGKQIGGDNVKVLRNLVDDEMVESVRLEFTDIKVKLGFTKIFFKNENRLSVILRCLKVPVSLLAWHSKCAVDSKKIF